MWTNYFGKKRNVALVRLKDSVQKLKFTLVEFLNIIKNIFFKFSLNFLLDCICNPKITHPRFEAPFYEYNQRQAGQPLGETFEHFELPHGLFNLKYVYSKINMRGTFIPKLVIQVISINIIEAISFFFYKCYSDLIQQYF